MVKEYRQAGIYSPIEQVLGRVKSISSILLKAQKHNIDLNEIEGHILDIAGIAGMWEAVFGDVGVTIIAVLNAMRILKK